MKHAYKVEAIRDDFFAAMKAQAGAIRIAQNFRGRVDLIRDVFTVGTYGQLPWVAEITGPDRRYGLARAFLRGQKDYTEANSVGSRGVYIHYILESGRVYEVARMANWKRQERYFFRLDESGDEIRMTAQEVLTCLNTSAA